MEHGCSGTCSRRVNQRIRCKSSANSFKLLSCLCMRVNSTGTACSCVLCAVDRGRTVAMFQPDGLKLFRSTAVRQKHLARNHSRRHVPADIALRPERRSAMLGAGALWRFSVNDRSEPPQGISMLGELVIYRSRAADPADAVSGNGGR
jgi:hypothetical protein